MFLTRSSGFVSLLRMSAIRLLRSLLVRVSVNPRSAYSSAPLPREDGRWGAGDNVHYLFSEGK
ncbi:MAG: hypothetical protein ACRD4R_15310 [Candidatus Acidiferrales bacterium]